MDNVKAYEFNVSDFPYVRDNIVIKIENFGSTSN